MFFWRMSLNADLVLWIMKRLKVSMANPGPKKKRKEKKRKKKEKNKTKKTLSLVSATYVSEWRKVK